MAKQNPEQQHDQHQLETDGLCATSEKLTARGGLLLVIKVFKALRLKKLADILFRLPGSNRGYLYGDILTTLVAMQNESARCLGDVLRLHKESGLLKRIGIRKIPGASTLSWWLHRHGQAGVDLINKLNQKVIAATLQYRKVKEVTLDWVRYCRICTPL